MKRLRWTVVKNALSNLIRGGATALVAVALPHFLARSLDPDRFAAWSLMLQIAAYASFLDFGLQTAVARFIAQALELEARDRIRNLVETAFALLCMAAIAAIVVILVVIYFAHSFFHGVPIYLLKEFQVAAVVLGLGAALLLPLSTFTGVLIGMHQNEFPAFAVGASRLLGATAAILAAQHTNSLTVLALCLVVPNLSGGLLQVWIVRRRLPSANIHCLSIDRPTALAFLQYCAGLTVWAFGMLLVSGLDVAIVGHYQFLAVGYYAIAATFTSIFSSANSSILSALLAPFAAMQASGRVDRMREIVIRSTRINALINVTVTALVVAFGTTMLQLWVGPVYAREAYPILVLLVIVQTIRLLMSAYSIALMATGHQNSGIVPVLVEGVVNLAASLWGVVHYGPIGVAAGSLVGSLVAMPTTFYFAVRSRPDLTVSRIDLGYRGMLIGILPALPALACAVIVDRYTLSIAGVVSCWTGGILCGGFLFRMVWARNIPDASSAA